MDLAIQTSLDLLGVKTLHSMAEVPDSIHWVRAGGGCARNDCRCARTGETLSANRLNGRFQSQLRMQVSKSHTLLCGKLSEETSRSLPSRLSFGGSESWRCTETNEDLDFLNVP